MGGETSSVDGFEVQRLTPDQAMAHLLSLRGTFRDFQEQDENPERDGALGDKGRVKTPYGDAEFEGDRVNGRMTITGGERFSTIELSGPQVEAVQINENGYRHATSIDLRPNGESFRVSVTPDFPGHSSESEFSDAVRNGAEALGDIPASSEEALLSDVFLHRKRPLVEVRKELLEEIAGKIEAGGDKALAELFKSPNGHTPRQLQDRILQLKKGSPKDEALKSLGEKVGWWQVLEDFPRLHADGLARTTEYYVSPQVLQLQTAAQGWEFDQTTGLPIADTVVVGGGPGGLASAYHLSENGHRTLLFEGGSVGQSFSDANAKSVHQLRTDEDATDLIYTANHERFGIDVSLGRQGHHLQKQALQTREDWYKAQDETPHGFIEVDQTTSINPVTRAELFGHMSQVAHGLATRYPDTFVCERSPVSGFEKLQREGETLVKVTTSRGHQVLTRSLVMATGFVGGMGEYSRSLKQFGDLEQRHPEQVSVLATDHDLIAKNSKISSGHLVLADRLLGRPEVRSRIKNLPQGSRVAFVGGGESAVKGALEVLHTNPEVKVDLYTSKPLEPYQTQVPAHILDSASLELALREPEFAKQTLETLDGFGTPITMESLRELFSLESKGRVRIREMGKRFQEDSVDVSVSDGGFKLKITDPEVERNLIQQRKDWQSQGMYGGTPQEPPANELPDAQMVVMAAGYDFASARTGPLVEDLVEAGLVEVKSGKPVLGDDGMTSTRNPLITFNTAAVVAMGADTTLHGRAVRAFRLAENFGALLPQREKPESSIQRGLKFGELPVEPGEEFWTQPQSLQDAREELENRNWSNSLIKFHTDRATGIEDPGDRASALRAIELSRTFPRLNSTATILARRADEFPESLTPDDRLLLRRAFDIGERTNGLNR